MPRPTPASALAEVARSAARPAIALAVPLALAAALGACQQRVAAPTVAAAPVPAPPVLPTGAGCGPEIARTQAIVASDVSTGNLNQPVGERFGADLSRASATCAAGHDGEALGQLAAAKARYGYR